MKLCYFEAAKQCSYLSDYHGASSVKVGAVAIFKRSVIAKGFNQNKTHPLQKKYNVYRYKFQSSHYYPCKIHAEMEVISKIRRLDINFSDVEIYVYREFKDSTLAMARPCAACVKAMKDLGIRKICYTTPDGYCEERFN